MSPKSPQLLVLFALVALTSQGRVEKSIFNPTLEELRNVVEHLKTHATKHAGPHKDAGDKLGAVRNKDNLNLYVKSDGTIAVARELTDVGEDRMCKTTGRCGCSRGRCGRQGDREEFDVQEMQRIKELEDGLTNDPLRCGDGFRCGKRCCGRGRNDFQTARDDDDDDYEQLRCKYGRCGLGCCSRQDSYRAGNVNENVPLRCKYGRCGRGCCGRSDGDRGKSQLEQFGKRYRVTNDLDAVVIDLSKYNGLLGGLADKLYKKTRSAVASEDREADLDYLFGDNKASNFGNAGNEEETLVVDLGQNNDDQDLITQLVNEILLKAKNNEDDDPVRPNELVNFYLAKKKRVIGNALNFVKNSNGKKDISNLSADQKRDLQYLRAQVQKLGAKTNDKEVEAAVMAVVLGEGVKSEVLPHTENNNNVYVPNWVHKAVKASREDLRSKRLFPLTARQKVKFTKGRSFWRRNAEENVNNYGVPFQLQIKGLGQVNP